MPKTKDLPQLLTERQAAERLSIGRTTLWRLRKAGRLESVNIGRSVRYRLRDVVRLAEEGEEVPHK